MKLAVDKVDAGVACTSENISHCILTGAAKDMAYLQEELDMTCFSELMEQTVAKILQTYDSFAKIVKKEELDARPMQDLLQESSIAFPREQRFQSNLESLAAILSAKVAGNYMKEMLGGLQVFLASLKNAELEELDYEQMASSIQKAAGIAMEGAELKAFEATIAEIVDLMLPLVDKYWSHAKSIFGLLQSWREWLKSSSAIASMEVVSCYMALKEAWDNYRGSGVVEMHLLVQQDLERVKLGQLMTCLMKAKALIRSDSKGWTLALKTLHGEAEDMVGEVRAYILAELSASLKLAVDACKKVAGGMTDGTSWTSSISDPADWSHVCKVAGETVFKADRGLITSAMTSVVEALC